MEREKVINLIRDFLIRNRDVVFAYVYGSFTKGESFKDIDVGVYVKKSEENPLTITSDIKTELSRLAKKENLDFTADQFDVKVVNDAPFTFLLRIFKEGVLLVDRDPDLRTDLVEYVSLKYRECAGLLSETSLL